MSFHYFRKRKIRIANKPESVSSPIPSSVKDLLAFMKTAFGESPDIVFREFILGVTNTPAAIVFIRTLVNTDTINNQVMEAALRIRKEDSFTPHADLLDELTQRLLPVGNVTKISSTQELTVALLHGNTLLFMEGYSTAIEISTSGAEERSISDPNVEHEVRGPRESFVENMQTNMSMVRRKINNQNLRFLSFKLGNVTHTDVCIAYVHGIADPSLIVEIKQRMDKIEVDGLLESLYVEEWIEDHPASLFAQIDHTERPDRVAAMLLEGRAAIIINGSPWVLIVPTVFLQFFTSSGDYYINHYFSSFLRWIRFVAFVFALTIPSFYIALITMHQEMIPTPLALRIAGDRSGVPFPAIVEALAMELSFEILREAGIRLPKVAGQAVSIVGALIIGEAAVQAGIVSPIMVIVVALTGISSFAIPQFSLGMTARLLRFPLMLLASIAGIPGITVALLTLLTYLASLKSFGVPYLSPLAPFVAQDMKDSLFRASWRKLAKGIHSFGKNTGQGISEFDAEDTR
ncbi:spore germination protein [Brevibacillus brevis]|uniref:spore germination protein n=1 Tax=Brevibacillus brevis TaxID=1393 RepID=UPI000D104C76|nr:spore germination protein [Brevibacillus brevis]PSJ68789.1 spore germination protein [Brevibacillus brevis]RED29338.1 spore germination protein KA [Brevibacillus brevis]GEC91517.1 spore germination protein KA [Brevibacillus brevis]VEF87939.1 Bacillus/Clostridium GerA spore germination protein [Brevibacillus brevis]